MKGLNLMSAKLAEALVEKVTKEAVKLKVMSK